jgi:CheY-like chemotaxis protein
LCFSHLRGEVAVPQLLENRPRVFVAEDDAHMRRLMTSALRSEGFEVADFGTGLELVERLRQARNANEMPSLLVSDVHMPHLSGLAVLRELRSWGSRLPVILVTAFGSDEALDAAFQLEATAVLIKPFDFDDLRAAAVCLIRQ